MRRRSSVAFGFLGLILLGAILLSCPWAQTPEGKGGVFEALFTACSAVCVTGLSVVDIAAESSFAGQIVLLVLVELGCLGLMTCGTFLLVAIGRRLSLVREFSLMNAYGVAQVQGLKGLICWVIGSMLVIETAGAVALYFRFHDVYQSIFYSVMGFCNAGFSLDPNSLAAFAGDPYIILTIGTETILGGIGFLVIYNLCTFRFLRRRSGGKGRLSLHTRVVLRFTALLLVFAYLAFLALEWNGVLRNYVGWQKAWVTFFQALTPRTCGFCITPTEDLHPLTQLIYEVLMVIGGGPGSAAAGMKVTTFAVLVYTLFALCRGDTETILDRRVVPADIVRESIVIFIGLVGIAVVVTGALFITEAGRNYPSGALFFEAVSAVTTTGLSVGSTTADLTYAGKAVIMVAMFMGRLGALTVVMMIGDRETHRHVRYPTEELVVG